MDLFQNFQVSGDSGKIALQETQAEQLRREASVTASYSGWDLVLVKWKFRVEKTVCVEEIRKCI